MVQKNVLFLGNYILVKLHVLTAKEVVNVLRMNPPRMIITTQTSLLEPCTMQSISADYSLEHTQLLYAHHLKRFVLSLVTITLDNRPLYQNIQYSIVHKTHLGFRGQILRKKCFIAYI
jgi:hypothetical protein